MTSKRERFSQANRNGHYNSTNKILLLSNIKIVESLVYVASKVSE